jgi:hypothetical protein
LIIHADDIPKQHQFGQTPIQKAEMPKELERKTELPKFDEKP